MMVAAADDLDTGAGVRDIMARLPPLGGMGK
jgi:hypothetical protein